VHGRVRRAIDGEPGKPPVMKTSPRTMSEQADRTRPRAAVAPGPPDLPRFAAWRGGWIRL
jgi:hypothetical protein